MQIKIMLVVGMLILTNIMYAEVFSEVLAGSFFELPGIGSAYTTSTDVPVKTQLQNKKV